MLIHRQKLLLALLDALGGAVAAKNFQKYLFLYTFTCEKNKSYDFVPYKFGCYSFQASTDRETLIKKGCLSNIDGWKLAKTNLSYSGALKKGEAESLKSFVQKFKALKGKKLIHYVYTKYPYFAINSQIAENVLNEAELASVKKAKPKRRRKGVIATIGYEGGSVENYLNRLITNDIGLLVDVRKNPLSRKYGFSKNTLIELLSHFGIVYIHLPDLGIESIERKDLTTQDDYNRLFDNYERTVLEEQSEILEQLLDLYEDKKRIALTCFEKEHTQCHRGRITNKLIKLNRGLAVQHL